MDGNASAAAPRVVELVALRRGDRAALDGLRNSLVQFAAVVIALPNDEAEELHRHSGRIARELPTSASASDQRDIVDNENYLTMQRVHSTRLQLRISRVAAAAAAHRNATLMLADPGSMHTAAKHVLHTFEDVSIVVLDALSREFGVDLNVTSSARAAPLPPAAMRRGGIGSDRHRGAADDRHRCALLDVFGYPEVPPGASGIESVGGASASGTGARADACVPCPSHVDPGLVTLVTQDLQGLEIFVEGSPPPAAAPSGGGYWLPVRLGRRDVVLLLNRKFPLLVRALHAHPEWTPRPDGGGGGDLGEAAAAATGRRICGSGRLRQWLEAQWRRGCRRRRRPCAERRRCRRLGGEGEGEEKDDDEHSDDNDKEEAEGNAEGGRDGGVTSRRKRRGRLQPQPQRLQQQQHQQPHQHHQREQHPAGHQDLAKDSGGDGGGGAAAGDTYCGPVEQERRRRSRDVARLRACVHRVARDPRAGFRTSCTFEVHPNAQANGLINEFNFGGGSNPRRGGSSGDSGGGSGGGGGGGGGGRDGPGKRAVVDGGGW